MHVLHRSSPPACSIIKSLLLLVALTFAVQPLAWSTAGAAPVPAATGDLPAAGPADAPSPADRSLNAAQRERIAELLGGAPNRAARQDVSWLAILVEFDDRAFPEEYSEELDPLDVLGQPDEFIVTPLREWFENMMARTAEYYGTVSRGAVTLQPVLADTLLTLGSDMGHYGDDDLPWEHGVRLLASEVVDSLDAHIDFSAYDLVTFIHAGPGQESDLLRDSPEQIWSGFLDYESLTEAFADSTPDPEIEGWPGIQTDDGGFVLRRFGVAPELELEEDMSPPFVLGALGVYAHQIGSYLGLLSLGDYQDPRAQGVGNFDLMGSGLWNALGFVPGPPCAFNRMLMGWDAPIEVSKADAFGEEDAGGVPLSVRGWEQSADSTLLKLPISDREYFLVENRDQDADADDAFTFDDANGNHIPDNGESLLGAEFDYYTTQYNAGDTTPGSGLFIWRIDEDLLRLTFESNRNVINAYNDHYGVMLLEADGFPDLSTVSYDPNAYGGDYDAFRAAGGPNDLVVTATAADANTLPDTRTAEGADSGWRFHSVSAHGPTMTFTARWEPIGLPNDAIAITGVTPVGDPLLANVTGDDAPEFVYLTTDGDSLFVHVVASGEFGSGDIIARVEGQAAGSIAAGNVDGSLPPDISFEIVLLTRDGRLFGWHGDGTSLSGVADQPYATVNAASRTPLLSPAGALRDEELVGAAGFVALVLEEHPAEPGGVDYTVPRWLGIDGSEFDLGLGDAEWGAPHRGLPVSDPALSYVVSTPAHGNDEFAHPVFSFALADSSEGGDLRVVQLASYEAIHSHGRPIRTELPLTYGTDANVQLAAGDLDADGYDDLVIETEGKLLLWYPAGHHGTDEPFFVGDLLPASETQALLPADLNGDGALSALTATPNDLAAFGPRGTGLDGWILGIDQTELEPGLWRDPSRWMLARRDAEHVDHPLLLTMDGRLFADRAALAAKTPSAFLGGNVGGSPVLADLDGDGLLELRGLSGFEPALATTAGEDTLLAGRIARIWQVETEWADAGLSTWNQGGADATRSRRAAATADFTPPGSGTSSFSSAYGYPNPAADGVTWRVETDAPDRFTVSLFDLEGQLRLSLEGVTDGFSPWEGESVLEGLASGVYFFVIRSETSGRLETGRLAIVR